MTRTTMSHRVRAVAGGVELTLTVPLSVLHAPDGAERVGAYVTGGALRDVADYAALLASVKEVGTVKWFDDKKGYGFLRTHAGDLFVHARHVAGAGYRTLAGGQAVRFFRRPAGSGRAGEEAVDVEVVVPGAESPA